MQGEKSLTSRQRAVLAHFNEAVRVRGAPPTIREVAKHFGFTTPRGAEGHLRALAAKGFLEHRPGERPAYRPRRLQGGAEVRILGGAPAGRPSEGEPEVANGTLALPWGFSDTAFAVTVAGESMRDAHILDGNLVVVDPREDVQDKDIVLAVLGGNHTDHAPPIR